MLHNDDQTPESPEDQKVIKSNSDLLKKKKKIKNKRRRK